MREGLQPEAHTGLDRRPLQREGRDLDKRYPVALALYAALAALTWFTTGTGAVLVGGKPVQLRWIPMIIIGAMALRTVLARQAEKIRRSGEQGDSSTPRSL
jgi:hypothetical protein